MADDTPDTFLGGLIQLFVGLFSIALGLAIMGSSLVLLVALVGVFFQLFFGSAPGIFQPFSGILTGFLVSLIKLLANVAMLVMSFVIIWLVVTGRMDEIMSEIFDEQTSQNEPRGKKTGKTRSISDQRDMSTRGTDYNTAANQTESADKEKFDEYGQLRK